MDRKYLRKSVGKTARDVFLYNLIMIAVATAVMVFNLNRALSQIQLDAASQIQGEEILGAGAASIIGVCAGLLYLTWRSKKKQLYPKIRMRNQEMTGVRFLQLFSLFMACQLLFQIGAVGAEGILNHWGYTLSAQVESASALSSTLGMFFYTAFVGPVAEEMVFRGFVLRSLQPLGKGLAILVSAVLFGVMHGNFIQGFFAIGVGFILGYVAVEYSMGWCVLMHILNNLVFSELLGKVIGRYSQGTQALVNFAVMGSFFVIALVTAVKKKEQIRNWWRQNRPAGRECLSALTTGWILLFFLLEFLTAFQGIQRI